MEDNPKQGAVNGNALLRKVMGSTDEQIGNNLRELKGNPFKAILGTTFLLKKWPNKVPKMVSL